MMSSDHGVQAARLLTTRRNHERVLNRLGESWWMPEQSEQVGSSAGLWRRLPGRLALGSFDRSGRQRHALNARFLSCHPCSVPYNRKPFPYPGKMIPIKIPQRHRKGFSKVKYVELMRDELSVLSLTRIEGVKRHKTNFNIARLFNEINSGSVDEALAFFEKAYELRSEPWKTNSLYIAKCYFQ